MNRCRCSPFGRRPERLSGRRLDREAKTGTAFLCGLCNHLIINKWPLLDTLVSFVTGHWPKYLRWAVRMNDAITGQERKCLALPTSGLSVCRSQSQESGRPWLFWTRTWAMTDILTLDEVSRTTNDTCQSRNCWFVYITYCPSGYIGLW